MGVYGNATLGKWHRLYILFIVMHRGFGCCFGFRGDFRFVRFVMAVTLCVEGPCSSESVQRPVPSDVTHGLLIYCSSCAAGAFDKATFCRVVE